jgi:hypothetical protein
MQIYDEESKPAKETKTTVEKERKGELLILESDALAGQGRQGVKLNKLVASSNVVVTTSDS